MKQKLFLENKSFKQTYDNNWNIIFNKLIVTVIYMQKLANK